MFKRLLQEFKEVIKEEYKFIVGLLLLYIILNIPLNYYITVGGGISDVSSRIHVTDSYDSKGSFNISYVTQLNGNVMTYLLSYVIPSWERESTSNYKYTTQESIEDINFRGDLDLRTANGTATYWAYTMANKQLEEITSKMYVIVVFNDEYETNLKVQDEIVSIDGKTYDNIADYKKIIQSKEPNTTIKVVVNRKGKEMELDVPLYESEGTTILGVGLQYVKEYDVDPDVNIKFKRSESGPSGGLITTLEIYNQLTKKDITHGYKIAGTGTIEPDGTIGQIGGIKYKIIGAEADKADYFIAPSGENYEEAKKYIKDNKYKIKLIEAKTIEDVIKKLEGLK